MGTNKFCDEYYKKFWCRYIFWVNTVSILRSPYVQFNPLFTGYFGKHLDPDLHNAAFHRVCTVFCKAKMDLQRKK